MLEIVYYDCENCPDKDSCRYKNLELIKDRYCFHPEMKRDDNSFDYIHR